MPKRASKRAATQVSNRTCLVASDEEDEDGNLSETVEKSRNEVFPMGEVVYLPEVSSDFQPEEEEVKQRQIPVVYLNNNSDGEEESDAKISRMNSRKRVVSEGNSDEQNKRVCFRDKKTNDATLVGKKEKQDLPEEVLGLADTPKYKQAISKNKTILPKHIEDKTNSSEISKNDSNQQSPIRKKKIESEKGNTVQSDTDKKASQPSESLKAAALMPPPMKRGLSVNDDVKKAKYARQATPICDAIMKEYSKRQKQMKNHSSAAPDLSDLPIKELMKKAKDGTLKKTEDTTIRSNQESDKTVINSQQNKPVTKIIDKNDEPKKIIGNDGLKNATYKTNQQKEENKIPPKMTGTFEKALTVNPSDPLLAPIKKEIDIKPVFESHIQTSEDIKPDISKINLDIKPVFVSLPQVPMDVKPNISKIPNLENVADSQNDNTPQVTTRKGRGRPSRKKDDDPSYTPKSKTSPVIRPSRSKTTPPISTTPEERNVQSLPETTNVTGDLPKRSSRPVRKTRSKYAKQASDSDEAEEPSPLNQKTTRGSSASYQNASTVQGTMQSDTSSSSTSQTKTKLHSTPYSTNQENQQTPLANAPDQQALTVAAQLKLIAEKIAETIVLNNESGADIGEAEKLLKTTQEFIKLQKEKSQKSSACISTPSAMQDINLTKVKQEKPDEPEQYEDSQFEANIRSLKETGKQIKSRQNIKKSTRDVKHSEMLKRKLNDELAKGMVPKITDSLYNSQNIHIPSTCSNELLATKTLSVQDKCNFVKDYFASYQEVFDSQMIHNDIPFLAEIIMLCVEDLNRCLQWANNKATSEEMRRNLLKLSYLPVITKYSEAFIPWFTASTDRIIKTKTCKALLVTFIFFITESVSIKSPQHKNQMHRFRRLMAFMLKISGEHPFLVWQILQTPNEHFEVELKLLFQILKYFQKRNFISVPVDLLLNHPQVSCEEEECWSTELIVMDMSSSELCGSPMSFQKDLHEKSSGSTEGQFKKNVPSLPNQPSTSKNNSKLSNIAAHFVQELQKDRDTKSKRIEEKLDHILHFLSGNTELHAESLVQQMNKTNDETPMRCPSIVNKPTGNKRNVSIPNTEVSQNSGVPEPPSEDRGVQLAQLFNKEDIGLDSLFQSYIKSTKNKGVQIKTEPEDVPENNPNTSHQTEENNLDFSLATSFVNVKQEPEDSFTVAGGYVQEEGGPLPFASVSVWGDTAGPGGNSSSNDSIEFIGLQDGCELVDSFTEEPVTFPKDEHLDLDIDPFH